MRRGDRTGYPDAMRAFRPLAILAGIGALILIFDVPGSYGRLLHLGVCAVTVFLTVMLFRIRQRWFAIGGIAVAVAYLPLFVWTGWLWTVVTVLCALYLFLLAALFTGPPPQPDPDDLPDRLF